MFYKKRMDAMEAQIQELRGQVAAQGEEMQELREQVQALNEIASAATAKLEAEANVAKQWENLLGYSSAAGKGGGL